MKTVLRDKAKKIRKNLEVYEISERIVQKIQENEVFKRAKHVMLFYPTKYEINLLKLLETNKNFYFPRVEDKDLLVCPYDKTVELKKSKFNIQEPCSKPVSSDILELILVPALMIDKQGYRLGYGGGYYDRFLAGGMKKCPTIGVIPKELYVEELPHEVFDVKLDVVISA